MAKNDTQPLTQVEFDESDFPIAERIARRLGYQQTAYTSSSALWGLLIAAFKRWAKDCAPAARAVLMARGHAEMERERVNAYIRPIFDALSFQYSGASGRSGPIQNPEQLYLCDDDPGLEAYYAACDTAHRAHGFTGPDGNCPALTAESLVIQVENALIGLAIPLFGVEVHQLTLEHRAKYLDLMIGACLKESE